MTIFLYSSKVNCRRRASPVKFDSTIAFGSVSTPLRISTQISANVSVNRFSTSPQSPAVGKLRPL